MFGTVFLVLIFGRKYLFFFYDIYLFFIFLLRIKFIGLVLNLVSGEDEVWRFGD